MRSATLSGEFPELLLEHLEQICSGPEIAAACRMQTSSPGSRALDECVESLLKARGYPTMRNVRVAADAKFDLDVVVEDSEWTTGISIEGGTAPRIDLDLLKFVAFARATRQHKPLFGALIVSNKALPSTITGEKGKRAFDYALRLRRLFLAATSDYADLLVVEFDPDTKQADPTPDRGMTP